MEKIKIKREKSVRVTNTVEVELCCFERWSMNFHTDLFNVKVGDEVIYWTGKSDEYTRGVVKNIFSEKETYETDAVFDELVCDEISPVSTSKCEENYSESSIDLQTLYEEVCKSKLVLSKFTFEEFELLFSQKEIHIIHHDLFFELENGNSVNAKHCIILK